ncbi:MAG: hypothetical protein H6855_06160 [Rhodospirillales bacterium]|nr:hypothetical protein [Rhodospirillales bacterium]MCB9965647.1 hypothetical protein [Rhodospirillales bacterium]MCB9973071.1 hypothetical protein [Rhodospirillales bacterium]
MCRLGSCFALLLLTAIPAYAVENDINTYKQQVIHLNRDIGTYYYIGDYISREIEDNAHQKVGSVQDFLINDRGEVKKIVGELNTQAGEKLTLDLDYADLGNNPSSYQLAYKASELEEKLASFLSNIETAAGDDSAELISARRLQGRTVTLPSGKAIGQVDQVITDKNTKEIVGVLMKDIATRPQYERFALPYPEGLKIKNTGFSNNLELGEDYAEVVQEFTAAGIPN